MTQQRPIKLDKVEILTLIRNDFLRELCLAEINVQIMTKRGSMSLDLGMNAENMKNLTHWEKMVENINNSIAIVDELIAKDKTKVVN